MQLIRYTVIKFKIKVPVGFHLTSSRIDRYSLQLNLLIRVIREISSNVGKIPLIRRGTRIDEKRETGIKL